MNEHTEEGSEGVITIPTIKKQFFWLVPLLVLFENEVVRPK